MDSNLPVATLSRARNKWIITEDTAIPGPTLSRTRNNHLQILRLDSKSQNTRTKNPIMQFETGHLYHLCNQGNNWHRIFSF